MKGQKKLKLDSDNEIIVRCQKGDVEAFEGIVREYQKKMFNISYRMIGDYYEAAEVVQDAFVAAYKAIKGFKRQSKFSTWLYTIVINLSKNRIKKTKTRSYYEQSSLDDPFHTTNGQVKREAPSGEVSVLQKLEKQEIDQRVQDCINVLESEFREVMVLRDIQGYAYEEISAILNLAEGTVKSRLYRAREAIRHCLKKTMGAL
jgi:RNA polymerase sigma-70 factor (ECF subfamily)